MIPRRPVDSVRCAITFYDEFYETVRRIVGEAKRNKIENEMEKTEKEKKKRKEKKKTREEQEKKRTEKEIQEKLERTYVRK